MVLNVVNALCVVASIIVAFALIFVQNSNAIKAFGIFCMLVTIGIALLPGPADMDIIVTEIEKDAFANITIDLVGDNAMTLTNTGAEAVDLNGSVLFLGVHGQGVTPIDPCIIIPLDNRKIEGNGSLNLTLPELGYKTLTFPANIEVSIRKEEEFKIFPF